MTELDGEIKWPSMGVIVGWCFSSCAGPVNRTSALLPFSWRKLADIHALISCRQVLSLVIAGKGSGLVLI